MVKVTCWPSFIVQLTGLPFISPAELIPASHFQIASTTVVQMALQFLHGEQSRWSQVPCVQLQHLNVRSATVSCLMALLLHLPMASASRSHHTVGPIGCVIGLPSFPALCWRK